MILDVVVIVCFIDSFDTEANTGDLVANAGETLTMLRHNLTLCFVLYNPLGLGMV